MKLNKIIKILIIIVLIVYISIYIDTHYAIIDNELCKTTSISIEPSLKCTSVREINKFNEIERLHLRYVDKNTLSKLKDFPKLNNIAISFSDIDISNVKKISNFSNLESLHIYNSNIDLKQFANNKLSFIGFMDSEIQNIISLSKCSLLEKIVIIDSTISSNCIVKYDDKYVMTDSSEFSYLDNIKYIYLNINEIQDISGILEMDSLETFCVNRDSISEEDIKLLEDAGIIVTYTDN